MTTWDDAFRECWQLRELADDWDGAGSPGVTPLAVDVAIDVGRVLAAFGVAPPVRCMASYAAGVAMEWHDDRLNHYRAVEVTRDGRVSVEACQQ